MHVLAGLSQLLLQSSNNFITQILQIQTYEGTTCSFIQIVTHEPEFTWSCLTVSLKLFRNEISLRFSLK